eukprot:SAG25_NODE_1989_length_2050_cov_159.111738_1_plen_455_part_01
MHKRSRTSPPPSYLGGLPWASLPPGPLGQVLALLPLRSVAAAARVCRAWAQEARVVRLRAQLKEALLEPGEIIWRRYSGGAERVGCAGFARFVKEVCGFEQPMDDSRWARSAAACGGTVSEGIDRSCFLHSLYVVSGRDANADADVLADKAALQALLAEAAACGPPVQKLRVVLEARLAAAARMRPMWTATAPRLLDIMSMHRDDVETVRRCCVRLVQLFIGVPSNQDAVGEVGGAAVLAAALQTHSGVEAVQAHGCDALAELMTNHPANQTAVAAAGGIEAVVAAMQAHPGVEAVQDSGCCALGNLVTNHPANQTAVAAAGGIEAVVAALRAHPGVEAVQADGCCVLGHLVTNHPANQTTVAAAGGIEAVVAALRAHPGAEAVQESGCCALAELMTNHPANQTAVAAAGGIEAVVAAMRAHPGAEVVQESGCCSLAALMTNHPANQTAVAAAGG